MKKLVLLVAVIASVSMFSCTGTTEGSASTSDSAAVDTAAVEQVVDSAKQVVDSVADAAKDAVKEAVEDAKAEVKEAAEDVAAKAEEAVK